MTRIPLLLLLALSPLCPAAESGIDAAAAQAAKAIPGACIVHGESRAGSRRFTLHGEAPGKEGDPEQALFEIGSISKVFTGLLLAIAVDEKQLSYQSTLSDLTDISFTDPAVGRITLLQLATHTSGLPRLPTGYAFDLLDDPYADYDRQKLDAWLKTASLEGEPPYDASYSNLGFGLLGDLLSRAYGKTWNELVQEKIAGPLRLTDTTQHPSAEQLGRLMPPRSGSEAGHRWRFSALAGAGALYSTASDLLRFGEAFIHPDQTPFAKPIREVTTIHSRAHGLGGPIGLGMMVRQRHGKPEFSHSGGTGGYRSHLQILPEDELIHAILINHSDSAPAALLNAADHRSEQETVDTIELDKAALDRLVGIYQIGPASKFTVIRRDELLMAQLTGQPFIALDPLTPTRFRYRGVDAELQFNPGNEKPVGLTLFQNGREIEAKRTAERPPSILFPKAAQLAAYEGNYKLGFGGVLKITARGDTLFAQLTNQPAFPVFMTEQDRFQYLVTEAALEFKRDANEEVRGLILHQNGQHEATKQ